MFAHLGPAGRLTLGGASRRCLVAASSPAQMAENWARVASLSLDMARSSGAKAGQKLRV